MDKVYEKGIILQAVIFIIAFVVISSVVIFKQKFTKNPAQLSPVPPTATLSSPTASSAPSASAEPTSPQPGSTAIPSYNINVLVIKYFPLSSDGKSIDLAVTGDVGESYQTIRQHTVNVTNNLKKALEQATRYLGYKNPTASSSLLYNIIDTKEYAQAVPIKSHSDSPRYPDYNGIMSSHNICDYVDRKGVREVWLWAYQGPNQSDGQPFLGILESKMSGPYGDISNSRRYNDMPICQNTYRVYTFNYGRGTAEALESWGHQMEAELNAIDSSLFREKFQGPIYPQTQGITGRCGSVHNPPNARFEYDRGNQTPQNSDCLDWKPDDLGRLDPISCDSWSSGCGDKGDADNPSLNYQIFNWQNLPGDGNTKTYQGKRLRNWWDVHGNFDSLMKNPTLFVP